MLIKKPKRALTAEGQEKIRINGYKIWHSKSLNKHGKQFDYSNCFIDFKTQKKPRVQIICKKHAFAFKEIPYNHIRFKSGGCKLCDKEQAAKYFKGREESKFLEFFAKNLSNKLDIRSSFQKMTLEMKFFCKLHKRIFSIQPTNLMHNSQFGCPLCRNDSFNKKNRLNLLDIKDEFKKLLPDHIKIIKTIFDEKSKSTKILIACEIHGQHLASKAYLKKSNHKCPACGQELVGYAGNRLQSLINSNSKGRKTFIGVMSIEVFGIKALKVGVTTRTLEERYKWFLKKIYFSAQMQEIDAYVLENQIHRNFMSNHDLRILKAGMRKKERWAGDTEFYWHDKKNQIIKFIKNYIKNKSSIDYKNELNDFVVPDFFPRDVSRPKDESNLPIAVIGVDPKTNKVVIEFETISQANDAGYKNISMVISDKYNRQISNGLRWFRKDSFDKNNIPPIKPRKKPSDDPSYINPLKGKTGKSLSQETKIKISNSLKKFNKNKKLS